MKIATYNINGINARLPVLLRWLTEESPDVVCLQELKAPQERFPLKEINNIGYHAVWHGQKSWNGVAVLSKYDIEEIARVLPGDPEDVQSRYLEVMVQQVVICCLYLPNGNPFPGPKFDYKLTWIERLAKRARALLSMNIPAILIGDFNIIPTEMDTYKPEKYINDALFRKEVKEAFGMLLQEGWRDSIRHLFPNQHVYTFWDYFRQAYARNAGLRIDHILLSPSIQNRLIEGGIDRDVRGWDKSSDHAPTWIRLKPTVIMAKKKNISSGLLLYKYQESEIYFFLVHPGGPFFAKRDEGWWTIPKGEIGPNEDALEAAKREFIEETGDLPNGDFIELNSIQQKGGKIVKCWAIEGNIDAVGLVSNTFEIEWPPRSGRIQTYPEIDRGSWFTFAEAKKKINERQISFLEQLIERKRIV